MVVTGGLDQFDLGGVDDVTGQLGNGKSEVQPENNWILTRLNASGAETVRATSESITTLDLCVLRAHNDSGGPVYIEVLFVWRQSAFLLV